MVLPRSIDGGGTDTGTEAAAVELPITGCVAAAARGATSTCKTYRSEITMHVPGVKEVAALLLAAPTRENAEGAADAEIQVKIGGSDDKQ